MKSNSVTWKIGAVYHKTNNSVQFDTGLESDNVLLPQALLDLKAEIALNPTVKTLFHMGAFLTRFVQDIQNVISWFFEVFKSLEKYLKTKMSTISQISDQKRKHMENVSLMDSVRPWLSIEIKFVVIKNYQFWNLYIFELKYAVKNFDIISPTLNVPLHH